ncbi:MAG: 3'(2'),5'-bisphosphate nucleotidase CysQ [Kofleriaceae bacterium]
MTPRACPWPASSSPLGDELATAWRLAHEAGALAVAIRDGADLQIERKAGDEPVTIADHQASAIIVAGLRAAFPDDVVISEELPDDLARLTARRVWYVDPIDGTKDFIRGGPGFSVMIGLCVDHVPVLGVVHQPGAARTFVAAPGLGGQVDDAGGQRALAVSTVDDLQALRLVASASHRTRAIDEVKQALGVSQELNIGSVGVKLALIGLGERDLYVNPASHCKAWDTCAPEAIRRAAGGALTDRGGAPLRYDQPALDRPRGLVASNGLVHAAVLARLAALFPPR